MKSFLATCPGFCGNIARIIDASLPESLPGISLASALSLMSTLKCGRVVSPEGIEPNLYTCIIAETGMGKGQAQNAVREILQQCSLNLEIGEPASDSGLLKALARQPQALLVWDEFGLALEELSRSSASYRATILKETMKLFSTAGKKYIGREKATEDRVDISAPYLNIFAASTPTRFYAALDNKFVYDGFLSRWLSFDQVYDPDNKKQKSVPVVVSPQLHEYIQQLITWYPQKGNLGSHCLIEKRTVVFEDTFSHAMYCNEFDQKIRKSPTDFERAFNRRGFELYTKLCLILSDFAVVPAVTSMYAISLVSHLISHQIELCKRNLKETDRREIKKLLLDIIGDKWTSLSDITRRSAHLSLTRAERKSMIEDFVESGQWEQNLTTVSDSRKKSNFYRRIR